jgi:hypothetical protein
VRAFLAEGGEGRLIKANQHTLVVLVWVIEGNSAADRNRINIRNETQRRRAPSFPQYVLESNPELTRGERQAGKHQEFGEVAPGNVVVLGPVYWKVLAPAWLLG